MSAICRPAKMLFPTMKVAACVIGALACLMSGAARADAIDGDWCREGSQRMSIQGETIVTPGGTSLKGQYSRHAFSYVVPSGEPGAGQTIDIILRGEYLAQSRQGPGNGQAATDAPVLDWRRCQGGIS